MKQKPFWSTVFKEHAETLHGIVRLFIVRVAQFRRPLGIFSSAFVDAASKTWCGFSSICLKLISRASQSFCSPMLLLMVEGPKVPLSRGLFGFVALRCYAEECAFSLSTQAQEHVWGLWDLVEYKRVVPAHCPTGATSGGTGFERNIMRGIPPPLFMRAPCSLHDWGVRT